MLTPIDIQRQDFAVKMRGYNADEVDDFLDLVGKDYEKLYKENAELRQSVTQLQAAVKRYEAMEDTLQQSIVLAHTAAEDIKRSASEQASIIINEAKAKAETMASQIDQDIQDKKNELKIAQNEVGGYKTRIKGICAGLLEMLDKME